jgi:hypothetical protein
MAGMTRRVVMSPIPITIQFSMANQVSKFQSFKVSKPLLNLRRDLHSETLKL